jgi:multidrug efflux system outer membrane protein
MNKRALILWAVIVLLGGCNMTPHYTAPDAPVPTAWPTGPAYKAPRADSATPTGAEVPWREFFTDEGLRQVIQRALDNNRDLRLAALNVQRARAVYGIQKSALYPSVDATAGGSKRRIPADLSSSGKSVISEQYDVTVGIFSWEIDFFGRIRSLKESALNTYLATEQARRSMQILIVSTVAEAYLALAADRENLKLAQDTLDTQQAVYDLIKRRYNVGLTSELDLYRAQTQVDIARGDIARYTQLTAQDQNALTLLTGSISALPEEILPTDVTGFTPVRDIGAGVSSEVLLRRPDILQAESLLKAANADIGAARAALFPRIALTTSVGTASSELSGLFDSGSDTWSFAPQISMPIFDARLRAAVDATKAQKDIAVTQYEKVVQTAFREVADTLAVYGTVDQRLAAQESLVRAATETHRLSNARYTRGIDSYLGVLDAQRSLYAAQQGLVALRRAQLANQIRLYAVLGGGADGD